MNHFNFAKLRKHGTCIKKWPKKGHFRVNALFYYETYFYLYLGIGHQNSVGSCTVLEIPGLCFPWLCIPSGLTSSRMLLFCI